MGIWKGFVRKNQFFGSAFVLQRRNNIEMKTKNHIQWSEEINISYSEAGKLCAPSAMTLATTFTFGCLAGHDCCCAWRYVFWCGTFYFILFYFLLKKSWSLDFHFILLLLSNIKFSIFNGFFKHFVAFCVKKFYYRPTDVCKFSF